MEPTITSTRIKRLSSRDYGELDTLRQAKAASRVTKTATKGVADAKALLADAQDAELAKALALVEKALAAKAGAPAVK